MPFTRQRNHIRYQELKSDTRYAAVRRGSKIWSRVFKSRAALMFAGACLLFFLALVIILVRYPFESSSSVDPGLNIKSHLDFGTSDVKGGIYEKAAIATDAPQCALVAREILKKPNATSMDAAIAGLLCNGIVHPHNMGIGGGFVMVIYDEKTGKSFGLNAREVAPLAATENMFKGNAKDARQGVRSIAVPGELHGYHLAHQRFGGIPWRELFDPVIQLLQEGVPISRTLAGALKENEDILEGIPEFVEVFFTSKDGKLRPYKEGEKYTDLRLAETFQKIADLGYQEFYTGQIGVEWVNELKGNGGLLTPKDLRNYEAQWVDPLKVDLDDTLLYSLPPPASGALLGYILNIMDTYDIDQRASFTKDEELLMWHRFIEAMKWAYARRTELGDPSDKKIRDDVLRLTEQLISEGFAVETRQKISDVKTSHNPQDYGAQYLNEPKDHGTAHLCIHGPDGLSISATSTINLYFGAKVKSRATGIIFNNEMDDFSYPDITNYFQIPPSSPNLVAPGKRPLSSMAPAVFVDRRTNLVRLILGAAGGTRITTAVAYPALRYLWLGQSLKEAIDSARLHHQLTPMSVAVEDDIPEELRSYLRNKGHEFKEYGRASTVGVARDKYGMLHAVHDFRKSGDVAGF